MEDKFPLRLKWNSLILLISIPSLILFIHVESKRAKNFSSYTRITMNDSIELTVQNFGHIRGGFTFNNKYIFGNFNFDKKNYFYISDLTLPFVLYKKSGNDTVFFIKENEKYFLTINKTYYKDSSNTIKNFGDMSLGEFYESWKQKHKK